MAVTLPLAEAWTPTTRWAVVAVATAGLVATGAAMACAGRAMRANGVGIVAFEKAETPARAMAIKEAWGADGRAAALRSLLLDFLFIVAYVAVPLVVAGAAAEVTRERGWSLWASVAATCGWAFVVAGVLDMTENGLLLAILAMKKPWSALTRSAWACASIKFLIVAGMPIVLVTVGVAALAPLP